MKCPPLQNSGASHWAGSSPTVTQPMLHYQIMPWLTEYLCHFSDLHNTRNISRLLEWTFIEIFEKSDSYERAIFISESETRIISTLKINYQPYQNFHQNALSKLMKVLLPFQNSVFSKMPCFDLDLGQLLQHLLIE